MTASPLAEEIPGAELRTIVGAGHLFWISHSEETVAAVEGFLGRGGMGGVVCSRTE